MSNFCRILRQDDDTRKWFEITLGSPYFEPGEPLFFDACWFALERAERNGDLALDSTYGVQDPSGNITTFPEKENLFLGEFDFLEENTGERAFTADIEVDFEPGTYFGRNRIHFASAAAYDGNKVAAFGGDGGFS